MALRVEILENASEYAEAIKTVQQAITLAKSRPIEDGWTKTLDRLTAADKGRKNLPTGTHPMLKRVDPSELALYLEFFVWLGKCCIRFDKTELRYFDASYRGLAAKQIIRREQDVLVVPREYMIVQKRIREETALGKSIAQHDRDFYYPNTVTITSFVMGQIADPTSKWTLMMRTMPRSVENFPVFFRTEELALLEGSLILGITDVQTEPVEDVAELKEQVRNDYDQVCKLDQTFAQHSFEDFVRAHFLVASRIFGITISGEETITMIPYAGKSGRHNEP